MTEPLTKKQQELIEQNHNLIYKFAYDKNLVIDEYYDILAIGMCKAAKAHDESKGKFSTIAYCCMYNELKNHWKYINKKSYIEGKTFSYDALKCTDDAENNVNLIEIISDNCSVQDIVENNILITSFINTLKNKEKYILMLLIRGIKQNEMVSYLNCSKQNVNNYVKRIRKKWIKYSSN